VDDNPARDWRHPWLRISLVLRELVHADRDREVRDLLKPEVTKVFPRFVCSSLRTPSFETDAGAHQRHELGRIEAAPVSTFSTVRARECVTKGANSRTAGW
jgi:hypothetical protein